MARPADLPLYENPPIDEVAIGLQFASPIPGFIDPHGGLFWQRVKGTYRRAESQPRIETPPEVLDAPLGLTAGFPQVIGPTLGSRTFLISDDDTYLLQIQNNRFYRNWRRRTDPYPHFEELENAFHHCYTEFCAFLADVGLTHPGISQAEVTYINWITDLGMDDFLRLSGSATLQLPGLDDHPQDQTWAARYLVRNYAREPIARLHVQCVPAVRFEEGRPTPGSQMSLSYIGPFVESPARDALEQFFFDGRAAIVRSFTSLTTEEAHQHWRRIQ